jgi:LPS sulfotransferase NodH
MAAGEAWIFDNWREHKVLNPTPGERIHLVADTAGTSAFWRLVDQAQTENFEQGNPDSRLIAFDPAARPKLMIERFNIAPVMPPAEVEQLAFDLLADLAPADERPESVAAVGQFVQLIVELCHDWRSLWSLCGDAPDTSGRYEQLVGSTRGKVSRLPPLRVASTGYSAQAVLNARLLAHMLGGAGDTRQEAAEFNVAAAVPGIAPGSSATRGRSPIIERPIIILSAPRAGSTLLFETLAQAAGVYTIGGESHKLVESIAALRPGRGVVTSNRLTKKDATTAIVAELRGRFARRLRDRHGQPPPADAGVRLLEKTPKNALRVPFLLEVFPDAQFIFLHREPRANLGSMIQAWRTNGWVTYRHLPEWPGQWSLLLPPGYERLQGRPLEEVVAFQWQAANETILDDLRSVPRERWTTVRYEELIRNPMAEVARLLKFADLSMDSWLAEYLSKPLPLSRHTKSAPHPDKWRRDAAEIERVLPAVAAVCARLPS